jgi:dsRNA-specific ribonuclease
VKVRTSVLDEDGEIVTFNIDSDPYPTVNCARNSACRYAISMMEDICEQITLKNIDGGAKNPKSLLLEKSQREKLEVKFDTKKVEDDTNKKPQFLSTVTWGKDCKVTSDIHKNKKNAELQAALKVLDLLGVKIKSDI